MKTLYRVLIILTVAVIIGGLMYAGVSASNSSENSGGFEEGRPHPPEGMEFRPDGDRDEGGFGFPAGMVKALVLMTVAGGIYSGIVWMGKKAKNALAR